MYKDCTIPIKPPLKRAKIVLVFVGSKLPQWFKIRYIFTDQSIFDRFNNSHNPFYWLCIHTVRRKLMQWVLVTLVWVKESWLHTQFIVVFNLLQVFFCGRSDYFRALLEYKLSESPQNEMFKESITEVYLNDVSPDVFAAVVAFIYQDTALVSGRVVSQSTYTGMVRPKGSWFQSRICIFWNISYKETNPRKCRSLSSKVNITFYTKSP